jgi:sugar phosphate isomerase/epimerase
VETDLPKAIEAIKKGGSNCEMITTNVESVANDLDVLVLETAAKCGVKYYRSNWFKYPENQSMPKSLEMYQKQIKKLSKLNQKLDIIGCYQNHAGNKVGASFWEIHTILEKANPDYFGTQYDIRHAMAEGTYSWKNGFELLLPHLKTIVLKDFKWEIINGKWKIVNVPIGEGMVDFDAYFKLLKKHNLNPPVSLHLEYDLGGAQKGKRVLTVDESVVYDAMRKDLEAVQMLWEKA